MKYIQNDDRLIRRQAKTATCLLEVNQNSDKRERRHSLNKYTVPFHGCFQYTCGYLFVKYLRIGFFILDIVVVLFSYSCAIEVLTHD